MQEIIAEFQFLQQRAEALQKNIEQFEGRRNELLIVKNSMDSLKDKKDSSILVPVGSGLFIEGALRNDKSVLVEVGANIIARKDWTDAQKLLDTQLQNIDKIERDIQNEISEIVGRLAELEPQIMEFYQKSAK